MKRIIIRVFGGKDIGYGHYFRCLSLAKAISILNKDIDIIFFINRDLKDLITSTDFKYLVKDNIGDDIGAIEGYNPSLFIFDSYTGNDIYLQTIKGKVGLMIIDDNNDIYDSSIPNIIYNGNFHSEGLGYKDIEGQVRLLGPKYLIMKEEYWSNESNTDADDGVLITTGGTDEYGIALRILNELKDLSLRKVLIIGPGYKNEYMQELMKVNGKNIELVHRPNSLKRYINSTKFSITAGGSTVYEVLSQGSMPLVFSLADNQDYLCKALRDMGIVYLGKYPHIDFGSLRSKLLKLKNEGTGKYKDIFKLVDGSGAMTTAKAIISYIESGELI